MKTAAVLFSFVVLLAAQGPMAHARDQQSTLNALFEALLKDEEATEDQLPEILEKELAYQSDNAVDQYHIWQNEKQAIQAIELADEQTVVEQAEPVACTPSCQNGGVCTVAGNCKCPAHVYGSSCQFKNGPFYRYFNGREHFYTRNGNEIGTTIAGVVGKYGYRSEGIACYIYATQVPGTVPLYRYYGANADHFYTTNAAEIGTTTPGQVGKFSYRSEGIAGFCFPKPNGRPDGSTPLHRGWNGVDHFYTIHKSEITNAHYGYEGVQCYVGVV